MSVGDGPLVPARRRWSSSRYLHIVSLILGGVVAIAALYGQPMLAIAIGIVISTTNSIGAYVAQGV